MTGGAATRLRLAVLASGGGTNLQALLDRFHAHEDGPARVELVMASRPGIGALDRAAAFHVPACVVPPRPDDPGATAERMLAELDSHGVDLVVLAGYLSLIPRDVVERFRGRMLNVHPALLPAFGGTGMYGMRVHRAVLESGVRVTGATVHLVDERYDQGRILAQWPVPIVNGDTPESLAARVLPVEHMLLPATIEAVATGAEPHGAATAFHLSDREVPERADVARLVSLAPAKPVASPGRP